MVALRNGKTLQQAMNVKIEGDRNASATIVLAHGFGGTQDQWAHVLHPLVTHTSCYRVLLFDWPGSSSTDPDDFDTTVPSIFDSKARTLYHDFANLLISLLQEELHIYSCTFVGHSMSAMIGCIAALHCPRLFDKLILVGASPRYLNDRDYYGGFEQEDLEQMFCAMEGDFEGWAGHFAAAVVGTEADQGAISTFTQSLSSMRPNVAVAMAKTIFESDYRGMMEEMMLTKGGGGGPSVHVLQTCKDLAVPLLVSDYLKQHLLSGDDTSTDGMNGRCLEILQTEGHIPHLSAPHLFCASLLRHLQ